MNGQMAEVRLWSGERTAKEIQDNQFRRLTGTEPGLLALWNFADGTARDASGHGRDGQLIGNARVLEERLPAPGEVLTPDWVLELDGTNSYVELPPNIFSNLTEATVEGWVKWQRFEGDSRFFDFGTAWQTMTVNQAGTNGDLRLEIWEPERKQHAFVVTNLLRMNEWAHIAAVSGPGGAKLYCNGVLVGSDPFPGSFSAVQNGEHNYLGRNNWRTELDWVRDFKGEMDEARVWNVQRTEQQIREAMSRRLTGTEPGLVGLWNFDDPANPGRDASPGGHDGKLMGNARVSPSDREVAPASAVISSVLALDGEGGVDTEAVVVPTTGDYTVECWGFASASALGDFRHLVDQDRQFYLDSNPEGKIRVGDSWNDTGVPYPFGGWHHFAVTKHSNGAELYIDGVVAATHDGPLAPPKDATTFRIGQNRYGGERWIGFIDEVRVWTVARTAAEIRENYLRNLNGTEPGLVGLWNFDDPANPGRDASPGGHQGKVVGNARVVHQNRPGASETEIPVGDEPLATLVPVEQRMTNMLRLDGDNGSMIVATLQGFGAGGNQAHTIEAWIRPNHGRIQAFADAARKNGLNF